MNRKPTIALAALALGAAVVALPAASAGAASSVAPTISLKVPATLASTTVWPALGDYVSYNTAYSNNVKNPYVMTVCYQNSVAVYVEGEVPTGTFTLGGGSSAWLTNGGGATCVAQLQSATWKAGVETITILASTSYSAAG